MSTFDEKEKANSTISIEKDSKAPATMTQTESPKMKDETPVQKKKKKPMQHLLAGGTAGLVESSVCHPLDTIKTRMQLRRQNTLKGRALGSMREAEGRMPTGGALHRTAASVGEAGVEGAAAAGMAARAAPVKGETVRVKADPARAAIVAENAAKAVPHDVGWKQRLPSAGGAATVSKVTAEATGNAASTAAKTTASAAQNATTVVATLGPFGTARRIVEREGPGALYKGLTAVYTGIVPKMAIRFVSFEYYRDVLGGWYGSYAGTAPGSAPPQGVTFLAGLLSGLTEAVLIVTPAEVCKIRMQSQYHSLMDPAQRTHAKYKNVVQTASLVVREEGLGALYKGVVPTMLRQGCNQAVNFTAYNFAKKKLLAWKRKKAEEKGMSGSDVQLDHWQSLLMGGLSGGMGPLVNNPLDVVKTRMQKQVIHPGKEPKYKGLLQSCTVIAKEEGMPALWKGITPRLMRIMPGQAITFMTYEAVSRRMEQYGLFD